MECPLTSRLSDLQIIVYLLNRLSKRRVVLPYLADHVPTINIFDIQETHDTFNRYADDLEIYFLTDLQRKNADTVRKWKRAHKDGIVHDVARNDIGTTKNFIYKDAYHGKNYFLREYTVSDRLNDMCVRYDSTDIAFCVLIKRYADVRCRFNARLINGMVEDEFHLQNIVEANTSRYVQYEDDFTEEFDLEYLCNFQQELLDLFGPI